MKYSEFSRRLEFEKLEKKSPEKKYDLAWLTHFLQGLSKEKIDGVFHDNQNYYGKAQEIASDYFEDGLQTLLP